MKKIYEKPMMVGETFSPDEYVAACGETEYGQYIFQCNAPAGKLYRYRGNGSVEYMGSFTPNPTVVHYADTTDDFDNGYIDYNENGIHDPNESVIVWIEDGPLWFDDYHATTVLDQDHWEIVKS